MRIVLLVDGPGAGRAVTVGDFSTAYEVMPALEPVTYDPGNPPGTTMTVPPPVRYRFQSLNFFDRIIEVGWSAPMSQPPFEALVEHLLTPHAKKAMRQRGE